MDLDVFPADVIDEYTKHGYWDDVSIADRVAQHAAAQPDAIAFTGDDDLTLTWRQYDELSARLAATLAGSGLERGDSLAHLVARRTDGASRLRRRRTGGRRRDRHRAPRRTRARSRTC